VRNEAMPIKTKIRLRTCEVCKEKKKTTEFSNRTICNKCKISVSTESISTLQKNSDDELKLTDDLQSIHTSDDLQSLRTVDDLQSLRTVDDLQSLRTVDDLQSLQITDNIQSLHKKVDNLTERFNKMETLLLGLMDLVGKMNYEMEINKIEKDE
jgi:hypothetical protein